MKHFLTMQQKNKIFFSPNSLQKNQVVYRFVAYGLV